MKLRHKASGVVIEGPFERLELDDVWRDETKQYGCRSLYHGSEWERVPEERWVDVTHDCEVVCQTGLMHQGVQFNMPITGTNYRIRKTALGMLLVERKEII